MVSPLPPAASPTSHHSRTDSGDSGVQPKHTPRLLIIANRLPISISTKTDKATGKSSISTTRSSGGLVSALQGLSNNPNVNPDKADQGFSMKWIGWPGTHLNDKGLRDDLTQQLDKQDCVPVFLDAHLTDLYYNGYCNNILWPLFHYIPLPMEAIQNLDEQYHAYSVANQKFADVIAAQYQEGDLVWIHDYHLMLLPRMVKQMKPDAKIGFFFHTPFPSSEIYRTLPSRKELLRGVLSATLLGFHTHDYQRHFQSACSRVLGASITSHIVRHENSVSFLGTFPIGIDPDKFIESMQKKETMDQIADFKKQFTGRKVLIGIDRLDYIKGIYNKLLGLERFLEQHPEWVGKVVLVQVAVPSRTDVPEYIRLRRTTHELVARINGKFGDITTQPIHYLDQSVQFDRMVALYRMSDAALITSIRDGMNLVAFEYIVAQKDQAGALILSEFAGAAQSLGAGCIQFNPWSLQEVADAIHIGLTLEDQDGKERETFMYNHVVSHTARHWAQDFIGFMQTCITEQAHSADLRSGAAIPPQLNTNSVLAGFKRGKSRLLVLGVGGCLTRWHPLMKPDLEVKPLSQSRPKLANALRRLANDNSTIVLLVSSLGRQQLSELVDVSGPGLWLCAENGYYLEHHDKPRTVTSADVHPDEMTDISQADGAWKTMYHNIDFSWKEGVMRVFEHFAERTPGTYIKQQDTFISWHYDQAQDKVFAESQAALVVSHLTGGPLNNTPTEVSHIKPSSSNSESIAPKEQGAIGNCILVRPLGVTKGAAVRTLMTKLVKQLRSQSGIGGDANASQESAPNSSDDDEHDGPIQTTAIRSTASTSNEASPSANTTTLGGRPPSGNTFTKRRPRMLNTDIDRVKYPFDFMLVLGSFLEKDEDVYTIATDYVNDGQATIKTGGQPISPALTSRSTRSPMVRGMNPSARNLAAMAVAPVINSPRASGTYSNVDSQDSVAISTSQMTQMTQLPTPTQYGQSTPTGMSLMNDNTNQLNKLSLDTNQSSRHYRGTSQDDEHHPLTFAPNAGAYADYSIPSPSMGAHGNMNSPAPAFGIKSSRARSSSTENMADEPPAQAIMPAKMRLSILSNTVRGKPACFTATVGNIVSKAQYKLVDTSAVEQLLNGLANATGNL